MATTMKRFMLSVTQDQEDRLDKLKKDKFYNKPQSEMVRRVIDAGLNVLEADIAPKSKAV